MDLEKAEEFFEERKEVVLAYLYGSAATGKLREDSDIDIGIFLETLEPVEKNPLYEARLSRELEELLEGDRRIEVRILNDQDLVFLHQVISKGSCFYSRTEKERVRFETGTMEKYFDFKPKIEEYNKARRRRLKADG